MQETQSESVPVISYDEAKIVDIARVCHEANRGICEAYGDFSQSAWDHAHQWQRDSAVNGVRFSLANPQATPANQHEAWCRDKVADGWKYGPLKDAELKEHPCLVPYSELPDNQKVKDHVFRAIVKAMTV